MRIHHLLHSFATVSYSPTPSQTDHLMKHATCKQTSIQHFIMHVRRSPLHCCTEHFYIYRGLDWQTCYSNYNARF